MQDYSFSAAALAAMAGVLVMAWLTPAPQRPAIVLAQVQSQNPSSAQVNPVTPNPAGVPSKEAIPEKIGEPVRSAAPSENTGKQDNAEPQDLREPPPAATTPSGTTPRSPADANRG
jgi:hypothetical protein